MNAIVKANQNAAVNFLTPTSLQEAMQIADLLAGSDIVPKDYQRKPGNILVAMQWGAEIGLQPLQAMQNIAVINGRPSIWGDAMLALVRSSGLLDFIREELSEDGMKATCTVKRKNEEPAVSVFTMEDAKKAGLSGKAGPWTQYPKRMLKLRARSYALRDVFPDVLKGMAIAEEEKDKEIDITPASPEDSAPKSNSGSSALKARMAKKQAVEAVAVEIDLTPFYSAIEAADSLDAIDQVGEDISDLNLGEPTKSEIGKIFSKKRSELRLLHLDKLLHAIDGTQSIEELNAVMDDLHGQYMMHLKDHADQINSAYDAQEAALTP
ncbi:transcriptional regulator [Acinetobacter bouvetii]|uniref:Transcriptional regulator n=1 Tax=Acinetobacter bouvetii TaxID=202951 RepID=A0A4Q7ALU5_9GAMM|nr:recombinase RecT [Acinetobacter bouvetii]RZG63629.1 transcriptional regulator [Acinetobacter bouvetii]